jgi:hypothetical protein
MASATRTHTARPARMHPARAYCLLVGPVLVLVGLLGFVTDSGFSIGDGVQGDNLVAFEVNGWHNLVHIGSGLLLLAGVRSWRTARTVALIFGVTYGLVTLIGLVDGSDVLGIIPVNGADNVLHLALSALAILAAVAPGPRTDRS